MDGMVLQDTISFEISISIAARSRLYFANLNRQ